MDNIENWKPIKNFDNYIGKCSIKNIQILERELLQYCIKTDYIKKNMRPLKDLIQLIISYLNEGAKINDILIFENYPKILKDLVILSSLSETQITYTIIQSLSYLLVNLDKKKSSLYYILSNNFLNEIIQIDFSKFDDEFFSFYINLLKSLSMRIDDTMLQFFYNPNYNSFPLVECTNKLYNHSNPMINTVVHNVSLQLMKLKNENIISYFSKLPTINYFAYLSCYLNDITNLFLDSGEVGLFEDMIDFLMYINDILEIQDKTINYIFINSLFSYFILPNLCNKIFDKKKKKLVLLTIIVLFNKIQDETFINCLFMIFFNEKIHKEIFDLKNNNNKIKGYCFTWKEQMKLKENFMDYICENYTENFLISFWDEDSLVYKNKKNKEEKPEIQKIKSFVQENISNGVSIEKMKEFIFSLLKNEEKENIEKTHILWSKFFGIKVGLFDKENNCAFSNNCFLYYMKEHFLKGNNCNNLIDNEINKEFISLINEKDCLYFFQFLIWTIINKVRISNELVSLCFSVIQKEEDEKNKEKKIINEEKKETQNSEKEKIANNYTFDNKYLSNYFLKEKKNSNIINLKLIKFYSNYLQNLKNLSSDNFEVIELMMKNLRNLVYEKANNIEEVRNLFCNIPNIIFEAIQGNQKINEYFLLNLEYFANNLNDNKVYEKNINSMRTLLKSKFKKIDSTENLCLVFFYLLNILEKTKTNLNEELYNPFTIYNLIDNYDLIKIKNNKHNMIIYNENNIICVLSPLYIYVGIIKKNEKEENYVNFETITNLLNIKNAVKKDKNNNFYLSYQNSKEIVFANDENGKKNLKKFVDKINEEQKKVKNYMNEIFTKEKILNYINYLYNKD